MKQLLELPLNLTIVSPAHTPNWDLVSDVVNSCSRIYRSSKQCRSRYESVLIPREEGKVSAPQRRRLRVARGRLRCACARPGVRLPRPRLVRPGVPGLRLPRRGASALWPGEFCCCLAPPGTARCFAPLPLALPRWASGRERLLCDVEPVRNVRQGCHWLLGGCTGVTCSPHPGLSRL